MSSLPVPVSPNTRTALSTAATRVVASTTALKAKLLPISGPAMSTPPIHLRSTLVCGSCDVLKQLAAIERLQHEGNRAISHRSSSDVVVVMRGDEHDGQLRPFMSDPRLQLDAVDAG